MPVKTKTETKNRKKCIGILKNYNEIQEIQESLKNKQLLVDQSLEKYDL